MDPRPSFRPRSLRRLLGFVLAGLLLGSCAESPTGPEPGANEVRVGNNFFTPTTRTVSTGTTVTWTWNAGSNDHNVVFTDGPASAIQSSGTFERTFNDAGTFPYQCTVHGPSMSGTVVVE